MASNTNLNKIRRDYMLGLRESGYTPFCFINSVNTNTGAEQAAVGDIIKVPIGKAGKVNLTIFQFQKVRLKEIYTL